MLIYIPLISKDVGYFSKYLLSILISTFDNYPLKLLVHFLGFWCLMIFSSLFTPYINSISN